MNNINLKRSEVMSQKGRINTPSFFNAQNLPEDHIPQLNVILTEILFPKEDITGDTNDENT